MMFSLSGAFVCKKGGDRCLSVSKVCDGFRDCPLGEDEEGCLNKRNQLSNNNG